MTERDTRPAHSRAAARAAVADDICVTQRSLRAIRLLCTGRDQLAVDPAMDDMAALLQLIEDRVQSAAERFEQSA